MIYTSENGELIEINRHNYVSESQYYSKVIELFKSYINAPEKDQPINAKARFENLETIEDMIISFNTKNHL